MLNALFKALKLFGRHPARAWLMLRVAGWIVILSCLVKVLSLPRALRLVSMKPHRKSSDTAPDEISTAIDAVLGLDFFVFRPNCWKRATILHRYLATRGVMTTIVFGLKKEPSGELKGHAWLECDGRPVSEAITPAYTVTYTFPSTDPFEVELALMAGSKK